ncbi:MAG: hypothetical protein HKN76_13555 [Saprospiraceae bacterium]|nr:hypothetical protein [Saprospiraceae bacterium]
MAKSKRSPYCYQYAAKFICTSNIPGTSQTTDALLPGSYLTTVNIHNPHEHKFEIRMKMASPAGISKWIPAGLGPDGVLRITCAELKKFKIRLIHGFEGFLVLESPCSLDVAAVYTAGNKESVVSIDVEDVRERVLCG